MTDKQLRNNYDAIANYCENWRENEPVYGPDDRNYMTIEETFSLIDEAYQNCARIARNFADLEAETRID